VRSFINSLICLWLTRHADFILWHAYRPIKARDLRCPVISLWDGETGVGGRYGRVTTLHVGAGAKPGRLHVEPSVTRAAALRCQHVTSLKRFLDRIRLEPRSAQ
jgi:hypothetical protein